MNENCFFNSNCCLIRNECQIALGFLFFREHLKFCNFFFFLFLLVSSSSSNVLIFLFRCCDKVVIPNISDRYLQHLIFNLNFKNASDIFQSNLVLLVYIRSRFDFFISVFNLNSLKKINSA